MFKQCSQRHLGFAVGVVPVQSPTLGRTVPAGSSTATGCLNPLPAFRASAEIGRGPWPRERSFAIFGSGAKGFNPLGGIHDQVTLPAKPCHHKRLAVVLVMLFKWFCRTVAPRAPRRGYQYPVALRLVGDGPSPRLLDIGVDHALPARCAVMASRRVLAHHWRRQVSVSNRLGRPILGWGNRFPHSGQVLDGVSATAQQYSGAEVYASL